jgi:hypothetical protein
MLFVGHLKIKRKNIIKTFGKQVQREEEITLLTYHRDTNFLCDHNQQCILLSLYVPNIVMLSMDTSCTVGAHT